MPPVLFHATNLWKTVAILRATGHVSSIPKITKIERLRRKQGKQFMGRTSTMRSVQPGNASPLRRIDRNHAHQSSLVSRSANTHIAPPPRVLPSVYTHGARAQPWHWHGRHWPWHAGIWAWAPRGTNRTWQWIRPAVPLRSASQPGCGYARCVGARGGGVIANFVCYSCLQPPSPPPRQLQPACTYQRHSGAAARNSQTGLMAHALQAPAQMLARPMARALWSNGE